MPPKKQPAKKVAAKRVPVKKTAKRQPAKKKTDKASAMLASGYTKKEIAANIAKKQLARKTAAKKAAQKKKVLWKRRSYGPGWDENAKCLLCRQMRTDKGHDPCIADLPGVLYACCGHGQGHGYIKFMDGRCLNFFPISMDLELPNHYLSQGRLVPLWVDGQSHKVLNMKTGRKKVEKSHGTPISNRYEKLVMDPIERDIDDQEA